MQVTINTVFSIDHTMSSHEHIQAIVRAWDILELIGNEPDGMRLSTIANVRGLAKPTVHNILRTLVHKGLVERQEFPVRYKLGPLMTGMRERRVTANRKLVAVATPIILRLARQLNASVELAQYLTGEVVARIRFNPEEGDLDYLYSSRTPLYGTGLLFQAYMTVKERADFRRRHPLSKTSAEYWGSYNAIDELLSIVKSQGHISFAKSGVFRTAAAVLGKSEQLTAMIRASRRLEDLSPGEPSRWVSLVRGAAGDLASRLRVDDRRTALQA